MAERLMHLPGTRLTPEVVLRRTLEKLGAVKAVTVIIQGQDDRYEVDWSQMAVADACMAGAVMTRHVQAQIADGDAA